MSKKKVVDDLFDEHFQAFKRELGVRTDKELADLLGIRQQAVAGAKRRRKIPGKWYQRIPAGEGLPSNLNPSLLQKSGSSTYFGAVGKVKGSEVTVYIDPASELENHSKDYLPYEIGDIGSFIRIPVGNVDIYAVVTEAGAGGIDVREKRLFANRFVLAEIRGQIEDGRDFSKGHSISPKVGHEAHLVTDSDLQRILKKDSNQSLCFGKLCNKTGTPFSFNCESFLNSNAIIIEQNVAIGKTCLAGALIESILKSEKFKLNRFYVFDCDGNISAKYAGHRSVLSVNSKTEVPRPLFLPYWALNLDELLNAMGLNDIDDSYKALIAENIQRLRLQSRKSDDFSAIGFDSNAPFSIKKLWEEILNSMHACKEEKNRNEVTSEIHHNLTTLKIQSLDSVLQNREYQFIFNPGPWSVGDEPNESEKLHVDALTRSWINDDGQLIIFNLAAAPPEITIDVLGACLRILLEHIREEKTDKFSSIIIMSSDSYLSKAHNSSALSVVRKIAKQGRSMKVGLILECQRPSNVDPDILSQSGNMMVMQLVNSADANALRNYAPHNIDHLIDICLSIRYGEALVFGEAFELPFRINIEDEPGHQTKADDEKKLQDPPIVRDKPRHKKKAVYKYQYPSRKLQID